MIDITGLDKADVLIALYNRAKAQGRGALRDLSGSMTKEEAVQLVEQCHGRFESVQGRVVLV